MPLRAEVVQTFLDLATDPAYLEIGVNDGQTFNLVRATRKVAVDPNFLFDHANAVDRTAEFHSFTSDEYFTRSAAKPQRFDVIFIDGLHTFEQALRDLLNAMSRLKAGGILIIDDVLPTSFDASLSDLAEVFALRTISRETGVPWHCDGSWMGDVYKVVFFIESFLQGLSFATVAETQGQTIVWAQTRGSGSVALRSIEEISRLDYRHTLLHRAVFNLQPLHVIVAQVTAARIPQ